MTSSIPKTINFVDIETTGGSFIHDRVIEIAIVKVEDNTIVDIYSTLINPQIPIPPFISQMTGIRPEELDPAPTFTDIQDRVYKLLKDGVFAAHNVRFDYGFLKSEFARLAGELRTPHFCTVKLFRSLFPGRRSYNLDSLISAFAIKCLNRHRALDDAKVIADFYLMMSKALPLAKLKNALSKALNKPAIPPHLKESELKKIPESPGVYIFYAQATPLYIGKSINLKSRINSHFTDSIRNNREEKLHRQISKVDVIKTAGDLGASILESELIKKYKPLYNRILREKKKVIVLSENETPAGYKTVAITEVDRIDTDMLPNIISLFKSKKQLKDFLNDTAKKHSLCPQLLGLENSKGKCFYTQLGWCRGACSGLEKPVFYNVRFIEAFGKIKVKQWPFNGPIVIKEQANNTVETFTINNWCVVKNEKLDEWGNIDAKELPLAFDMDIYRIITRYFKNPHHLTSIHTT